MKYVCSVATDKVDQDSDKFSAESLKCLAEQLAGLPIKDAFGGSTIGSVVSSEMSGDESYVAATVTFDVNISDAVLREGLYVVPGFSYDLSSVADHGEYKEFSKIKVFEMSITETPADSRLQPIREVRS